MTDGLKSAHGVQRSPAEEAPGRSGSPMVESFGMALIGAGREAQRILDQELAQAGMTMRHLGALGHLARDPDLSISDLARRSQVTAQSMHATVRGLEERGAVTSSDQGRGRASRLTVTTQGLDLLREAREAVGRLDATLTQVVGEANIEQLRVALMVLAPGSPSRRTP